MRIGAVIGALALVILLIALWSPKSKRTAPPSPSPPEVAVVDVERKDVPIYSEWIGTLGGMVNAEIKARVSGYLLRQHYTESSFVSKGQLLIIIFWSAWKRAGRWPYL